MDHRFTEMLQLFDYEHLPPELQEVSKPFSDLAHQVAERTALRPAEAMTALRKLLEAKDCAVRAVVPVR